MTSPAIAALLDDMTLARFQMTRTRALELGCCVRCKHDPDLSAYSDLDRMEWHLSALCPGCYAEVTAE